MLKFIFELQFQFMKSFCVVLVRTKSSQVFSLENTQSQGRSQLSQTPLKGHFLLKLIKNKLKGYLLPCLLLLLFIIHRSVRNHHIILKFGLFFQYSFMLCTENACLWTNGVSLSFSSATIFGIIIIIITVITTTTTDMLEAPMNKSVLCRSHRWKWKPLYSEENRKDAVQLYYKSRWL